MLVYGNKGKRIRLSNEDPSEGEYLLDLIGSQINGMCPYFPWPAGQDFMQLKQKY
jgi:hypothetical protein